MVKGFPLSFGFDIGLSIRTDCLFSKFCCNRAIIFREEIFLDYIYMTKTVAVRCAMVYMSSYYKSSIVFGLFQYSAERSTAGMHAGKL